MVVISISETRLPEIRKYKLNEKAFRRDETFVEDLSSSKNQMKLVLIGETGKNLIEGLFKIKGVEEVFIHNRQELFITIKENYAWIDIDNELMSLMRKVFGKVRRSFLTWISNPNNVCI